MSSLETQLLKLTGQLFNATIDIVVTCSTNGTKREDVIEAFRSSRKKEGMPKSLLAGVFGYMAWHTPTEDEVKNSSEESS